MPAPQSGGDDEQGDGDVDDEAEVEKLDGGDGYVSNYEGGGDSFQPVSRGFRQEYNIPFA